MTREVPKHGPVSMPWGYGAFGPRAAAPPPAAPPPAAPPPAAPPPAAPPPAVSFVGGPEDIASELDALGAAEYARRLRTSPRPWATLAALRTALRERAPELEVAAGKSDGVRAEALRRLAEEARALDKILERAGRGAESVARACAEIAALRDARASAPGEAVVRLRPVDPDGPLVAALLVPASARLALHGGGHALAREIAPGQVALLPHTDAEGRRRHIPCTQDADAPQR